VPPPDEADLAGMYAALALAHEAEGQGEVPVGAVVMRAGRVLGRAHNQSRASRTPLAHAEMLAIAEALATTGEDRLPGATLYVTLEPCAMCAGAIVLAKITRVVFGAWDEKAGMGGSRGDLLRQPRLNHQVEVLGGVRDQEAGELLTRFFSKRR
jgi:tRNA(adenine34) deaminase